MTRRPTREEVLRAHIEHLENDLAEHARKWLALREAGATAKERFEEFFLLFTWADMADEAMRELEQMTGESPFPSSQEVADAGEDLP